MKTRNTAGPRNPEASQPHEVKPTSTWQRTRVTTSTAKLRRSDNQGPSVTTPSYQQTLEARGKNPSKDSKKTPVAWTTKLQEPPRENQDKGRRVPPKEGRTAAYQPKSEQTPKEENPGEKNRRRGCDQRLRRQNGATETPEEPNTQELQVRPQTCDQITLTQEQVKDKQKHEQED